MSEIRNFSDISILISQLKSSIQSRKELINHSKELLKITNSESRNITIKRIDYENIIDEFEFTILQSLQAIKFLEIEYLNNKEIILELKQEKERIKKQNEYTNNQDMKHFYNNENEELSNYKFKSPTNTNFNYQEYFNKQDLEQFTFSNDYKINDYNRIENEKDFNPSYHIDPTCRNLEKKLNSQLSTNYLEENKILLDKTENKNTIDNNKENEDNYINIAMKFKLNFDYSSFKEYENMIHPIPIKNYDMGISSNLNTQNGNEIAEKDNLISTKNDNINHLETVEHNQVTKIYNESKKECKENQIPEFYNSSDIIQKVSENNINDSSPTEIIIKEGLRHKIRNKSKESKNNSNINIPQEIIKEQFEEDAIQSLNADGISCENNNRFDHRGKVMIFNMLNRINNDDKLKEYFAFEFGGGNYDLFLKRYNHNELDFREIENIINFFSDLRNNQKEINYQPYTSVRKESQVTKQNSNTFNRSHSNRSLRNRGDNSVDSRNNKRKNLSMKDEIVKDIFVEPIKFENFLRNDKKKDNRDKYHRPKEKIYIHRSRPMIK